MGLHGGGVIFWGGNPRLENCLIHHNAAWDTGPVFSPDGSRLAYLAMSRPGYEADRFRIVLQGYPALEVTDTLEQAVNLAHEQALPGDEVLLSPACACFDEFPNFVARGNAFRAYVATLAEANP